MQDAIVNPDGGYWSYWLCTGVVGETLDKGGPLYDWAEDIIVCLPLGGCVVLVAVLLHDENDQDLVSRAECGGLQVGKLNIIIVEGNVFQCEDLGLFVLQVLDLTAAEMTRF